MRHRVNTRKLGRTSAHRVAMYRNLVSSLLEHEKLETTHAKARELKRLADRMITLGKRGDLHARRQAMRVIHGREVTAKLFGELALRYAGRPGGYTRVLRTRRRVGDAAEMSIVQLVEALEEPAAGKPSKRKKTSKKRGTSKKEAASAGKPSKRKTAGKSSTAKKTTTAKRKGRKKTAAKADTD